MDKENVLTLQKKTNFHPCFSSLRVALGRTGGRQGCPVLHLEYWHPPGYNATLGCEPRVSACLGTWQMLCNLKCFDHSSRMRSNIPAGRKKVEDVLPKHTAITLWEWCPPVITRIKESSLHIIMTKPCQIWPDFAFETTEMGRSRRWHITPSVMILIFPRSRVEIFHISNVNWKGVREML